MRSPRHTTLIVFAKAPIAGYAKTRLIPALGKTGAANFHMRLVKHALTNISQVANLKVHLYCSEAHPFFVRLTKKYRIQLFPQASGDLDERMQQAFKNTSGPALLMGSDCPSITSKLITQAIHALNSHDVVVLPAEDGGYGLIGFRDTKCAKLESIFQSIPWGTDKVMKLTRERLKQAQMTWQEPQIIWDVDEPQDIPRFEAIEMKFRLRK